MRILHFFKMGLLSLFVTLSVGQAWATNPQCGTLVDDLTTYNSDTRINEYVISDYLSRESQNIENSYNTFKAIEGKSSVVPVDTFLPLKDLADQMKKSSQMVDDNSAFLENRFQELLARVSECLK